MKCPFCNRSLGDDFLFCPYCGKNIVCAVPVQNADRTTVSQTPVLHPGIFLAFFALIAFFPLGVVATVYALRAAEFLSVGLLRNAYTQARKSRRFSLAAYICGAFFWFFVCVG